jgi:hypothetical protein
MSKTNHDHSHGKEAEVLCATGKIQGQKQKAAKPAFCIPKKFILYYKKKTCQLFVNVA